MTTIGSMAVSEQNGLEMYRRHVNPRWAEFLEVLGLDANFHTCSGEIIRTSTGRDIVDFVSGYCVYNLGHNHPTVLSALHRHLNDLGP